MPMVAIYKIIIVYSYLISAMVTLANTSKLVASSVKVDPDIIVQTVFREAKLQDIPSGHGFQVIFIRSL